MSYLGENLVFIISQPKAGSTLLQRILAGHPDIQTSAETWLMLHPVYGLRKKGIEAEYNARWAATGVTEFLDNYADGRQTYVDGLRSFAGTIYGRVLEKHGKKLFLDKTPRYTMIIDELIELFPEAKYVLLIRNPLAILKSELHTYVGSDWQILSEFAPDLVAAPQRLVDARRSLGKAAFELKYEDLVAQPENIVRELCGFLGASFNEGMLDYSDTPAPVGRMNDPVGIHRHTRPSTESLDKWKELGSDAQLCAFALSYLDTLGSTVVSELGYDPAELRREIENTPVDKRATHIYPWSLAITPKSRWNMRDHVASAYLLAAQRAGRVRGILAALNVVLERLGGGISRLAGAR
jgi:hypothetical protein